MRRLLSLGVPTDVGFKLGMFMTALQALSTIALMLTSAFLISYSSEQPPILYLMLAVVGVRAFALGRAVFRYAERWFLHNSVFKMMSALRPKLFKALVPFAPGGLRGVRSGDQLSRFNSDVENIQNLALRVIGPVFQSLFALILATGFLMFVDLASALALFLVGLIAIFIALVVSYVLSAKENSSLAEVKSELENSLVEYFQQRELLAAFGWESVKRERIAQLSEKIQRVESRNALSTGISSSIFSFLTVVATVFVATPAALAVEREQLAGSLLAVVILLPLALFDVFANLQPASGFFQKYLASAKRITELTDREVPAELISTSSNQRLSGFESLRFKGVSLKYPDSQEMLTGIDFELKINQWLAIQGPSGVGKTTLALAAVGLLNPIHGEIKINNQAITNFSLDSIRETIGLIEQHPHVFAGTVRQNLLIADDSLSDQQLVDALKAVDLWSMLEAREGLDTELGEKGKALSGGEIQRISIARALLAKFQLLILDEPTSALDNQSAIQLMSLLGELRSAGLSLITITHDPEMAEFADSVYMLKPRENSEVASVS